MRWQRLFAELEARFADLADEQSEVEAADRERVAFGAVGAQERLSGAVDGPVRLRLIGGATVSGTLSGVGPDWLLVADAGSAECVVPWAAVTVVEGLSASTGPALAGLDLRFDLRYAVRGLVRDRAPVRLAVHGWTGDHDGSVAGSGSELIGTLDRVGADFVELALHPAWEPRRAAAVRGVALVPLRSILLVRALPLG